VTEIWFIWFLQSVSFVWFDERERQDSPAHQIDRLRIPPPLTQGPDKTAVIARCEHGWMDLGHSGGKSWGNKNETGYFSGVFRGRPRGRKVDKLSEPDAIWACHSGEPTAREELHAPAIVHSLTRNPYCS
jgi:hypothetical protein